MGQKNPFEFNIWETEEDKEERHKREREKLQQEHLTPGEIHEREKREEKFIDVFSERFQEIFKKER